jgi:hypothetical protein
MSYILFEQSRGCVCVMLGQKIRSCIILREAKCGWEKFFVKIPKMYFPRVRIGLNESQDKNCSSKQIQLPKAMFREGNERVVCSRL